MSAARTSSPVRKNRSQEFLVGADTGAADQAEHQRQPKHHRLARAGRRRRVFGLRDHARLGDRKRTLLRGLLVAGQERLVERGERRRLLLQLAQPHHRLARLRILAGHLADIAAQRRLARFRDLVFVAIALGELLQLLENLPRHIGLLAAQRHRLRMVLAEARRDVLLALGDVEIAGLQLVEDGAVGLVGRDRRILDGVFRTAVDDRLVLRVAGQRVGRIGLRDDQLAVEVGELLLRHQLAARRGQPVFGPEPFDLERRCLRAVAQLAEPALQPHRGALGRVEIGVEVIGKIGVGIGARDRAGELGIVGAERHFDDEAAPDPLGGQARSAASATARLILGSSAGPPELGGAEAKMPVIASHLVLQPGDRASAAD